MADENSSKPVPEHWKLVTEQRRNGSQITVYKCQATGQRFNKYEDLIRYVNYAKAAQLGIYSPYYGRKCSKLKKTAGSSYADESDDESSGSGDSGTKLPHIATLELVPTTEKASMDESQSESGEKTRREMQTPCSSEASINKLPRIASLEIVPATEKASMDECQSESGEKTRREMETPCSSETSTNKKNKKKNKNKNKNKKHKRN